MVFLPVVVAGEASGLAEAVVLVLLGVFVVVVPLFDEPPKNRLAIKPIIPTTTNTPKIRGINLKGELLILAKTGCFCPPPGRICGLAGAGGGGSGAPGFTPGGVGLGGGVGAPAPIGWPKGLGGAGGGAIAAPVKLGAVGIPGGGVTKADGGGATGGVGALEEAIGGLGGIGAGVFPTGA